MKWLRGLLVGLVLRAHFVAAGRDGFSWIHGWSLTKGLSPKGEPDPPAWVQAAWAQR